jgi:hypothetical protein
MPLNSPELILLEIWSANQLLRIGCEEVVWIALPATWNARSTVATARYRNTISLQALCDKTCAMLTLRRHVNKNDCCGLTKFRQGWRISVGRGRQLLLMKADNCDDVQYIGPWKAT